MAAPKPADGLPDWATDGGADIDVPSGGKRAQGWVAEKPPHSWFNWWMNLVYRWLVFLDGQFSADGVQRLRMVSDAAALRAVTGQASFDIAFVTTLDLGVFYFGSAFVGVDDGINIITPSVGPGRWVRMGPLLGQTNGSTPGLATLDASNLVLPAQLDGKLVKHWGRIQLQAVAPSINFGSGTFAVSYDNSPGFKVLKITWNTALGSANFLLRADVVSPAAQKAFLHDSGLVGNAAAYGRLAFYQYGSPGTSIDAGTGATLNEYVDFFVVGP